VRYVGVECFVGTKVVGRAFGGAWSGMMFAVRVLAF
jgi:hypothetical protein